jgi:hypothetical protein
LDSLAAAINRIVKTESDGHKHAEFYFKLLACFRKQTSDNRFLLLTSLKGMDIHPLYTLDRLQGEQEIVVKPGKKNIKVILRVKNHPGELDNIDCYCYDVLLLTWKNRAKTPGYCRQLSDWIYLDKAKPEFEFSFEKPGDIREWMLCLKKNMELNKENVSLKLQGMRIMEVGTFDKKDIALLKKIAAKEKKRNSYSKNEKLQMVRVKAKKRREK